MAVPVDTVSGPLAAALAAQRLRIVAGLIRVTGDWDLAEDAVQDAVERALVRWPRDGVPENPAAWLTTTAQRCAIDVLRRRRNEIGKLYQLSALPQASDSDTPGADSAGIYRDDQLGLLFTCCHPALPLAGRVALTLKVVAGLSTRQVAAAFLVSEATMSQRLLRTRTKISHAGITFRVRSPHRVAERTAAVLAVVYLLFTEGYASIDGERTGDDLAAEAVRLVQLMSRLLPQDGEVHGLKALLLLQHARRDARTDVDGDLVPMGEQDRSRWDADMITAALGALATARAADNPPGPYQLQAEIAAVHASAPTAAETDWASVVTCFDALLQMQPSPVVAFNRAVAVGFRDGPVVGLAALDDVAGSGALARYHLVPAARADVLRRAGRNQDAAAAYQAALDLDPSRLERRFLQRRLQETLQPLQLTGSSA